MLAQGRQGALASGGVLSNEAQEGNLREEQNDDHTPVSANNTASRDKVQALRVTCCP